LLLLLFTEKIRRRPPNSAAPTRDSIRRSEIYLAFDNVVEICSFGGENHPQPQLSGARKVALTNNAFHFLLRGYPDVLQEFAER
jgi:hypothetical protein